jgi:hypothetical protein
MCDQNERCLYALGDRGEVLERVVGSFQSAGAIARFAVWTVTMLYVAGTRRERQPDGAARTGTVVDDDA